MEAKSAEDKKCLACGYNGRDRVLLSCEFKGESGWVCVKCLPPLIHGMEERC